MVRRTKGPLHDEALPVVQGAGYAVDPGRLECLFETHVGQYAGEPGGEHGFARARGADHEKVVASSGGDGEGALHMGLPFDVAQIGRVGSAMRDRLGDIRFAGFDGAFTGDEVGCLFEGIDGVGLDSGDYACFFGVRAGHEYSFEADVARGERHRESADDGSNCAVEGQFADNAIVGQLLPVDLFARGEQAERNGDIERAAFFAKVGGGQIDHGDAPGYAKARVFDGRVDALLAFLHGGIGQADDSDLVGAGIIVDLDDQRNTVDPENCARLHPRQHAIALQSD